MSVRSVQSLFGLIAGVAVARTLPALVRYYAWFRRSGLEISKHRGYGQSACKLWGVIPAPSLSVNATAASGVALLLCLVAPVLPVPDELCAPLAGAALVFYHLYFSQMYCEAHVGAHVTVMLPPMLVFLALTPAGSDGVFTAWLMKIVLTTAYCGAGVSKIANSLKAGRSWCDGATMQGCIFEALLLSKPGTHSSFGIPTPFSHELQRLAVHYPKLLSLAAYKAVAFETLAPLVLLASPKLASFPFACTGLLFHYGIAVLQNIDFISWWAPAYAVFLLDPAASLDTSLAAATAAAFGQAPLRASLAVAYVAAHIAAVVLLRFMPNREMLPFSSFTMFSDLKDLNDPRNRKWFWLSDKPHATGTLKNYCFPFCRPQVVLPSELPSLGFKYVLFGHGGTDPDMLHSNVKLTRELRAVLTELRHEGRRGSGVFCNDANAMPRLLSILNEAKAAFALAPRSATTVSAQGPSLATPVPRMTSTATTQKGADMLDEGSDSERSIASTEDESDPCKKSRECETCPLEGRSS